MLTKDVSDELENVLNTLVQQGKEPTVALVKARLKTPVPMPALIATIRSWKSVQRVPKIEVAEPNTETNRIQTLETKLEALEARVIELEKLLNEK